MSGPLKILILEDQEPDVELMLLALRRDGLEFEYRHVDNREDFIVALDWPPDIILSDFSMPDISGPAALDILQSRGIGIPLIIVSGTVGEETAVMVIRNGAADYLLKDRLGRLGAAVRQAMERKKLSEDRRRAVGERRQSEQRYLSLVNTIDGIVFEADAETFAFTFVNQRAEKMLGYPVGDWLSQPDFWARHVHPEDREAAVDFCRTATLEGRAHEFEYRMIAADGRVVWIHDIVSVVKSGDGPARLRGIMVDVTERRRQDEKIARLTRIQSVMSQINSAIVRIHDRQILYDEACRIAVRSGGFALAWAGIHDPVTRRVTIVARDGKHEGYIVQDDFSAGSDLPLSCQITATAIESRMPAICNDIASDPREEWRRPALERGFRSLVILPLLVDSNVDGVLALYSTDVAFFNPNEMKLLNELAGDISFGLQYIKREEEANYLAFYDALTGLTNRTMFLERVNQHVRAAELDREVFAILKIDIDRFKAVNETHGRQAGDNLIKQVAERLLRCVSDRNQIARIGSIRFGIVLPGVHHADDVARHYEREIAPLLAEPFRIDDVELRVTARAGIAMYPQDGTDAETLFIDAEAALKKARAGGDRYLFYTQQMTTRVADALHLENELRAALLNNEFVLYYQPELDVKTRRVTALEALIRWQSPTRGLVPPLQFIPLLEETGLIVEVGDWVLNRAIRDCRQWQEMGLVVPRVAVNVSARQFRQKDFVGKVEKIVRGRPDGINLDLEITESAIMENIEQQLEGLRTLHAAGLGIVVDDFGTGYSSLSYIARLPISTLKIDRSFVIELNRAEQGKLIVGTIINLAHGLDLKVVAEGVETETQLALLRKMSCDDAQGYLFSKPMSVADVARYLSTHDDGKRARRRKAASR